MTEVTAEMRVACAFLHSTGTTFLQTRVDELPCGCIYREGWDTGTVEGAVKFHSCSDEHAARFREIQEGWYAPETLARYGGLSALESIRLQMASS